MNTDNAKYESEEYEFSYKYFENRHCKYYPCHSDEHINCLFCFCPFYNYENCPGTPSFIQKDEGKIKSCMECTYPHQKENYDAVMKILAARKNK